MDPHSSESDFATPASPIALGIQLGTSSYRLTYLSSDSSTPVVLLDCFGNETTPAYFAVDGHTALFGDDARNFASLCPSCSVKGIIKFFREASSLEGWGNAAKEWDFCNTKDSEGLFSCVTPETVLGKTVEHLLDGAKQTFQHPIMITSIVASVSHCYLPAVNKELKIALIEEQAPRNIVPKFALVPKTMAAFVGYAMNKEICEDGLYSVLFVGASVSELAFYEVIAGTGTLKGDILSYPMGGNNFDEAVLQYCCKEFDELHPVVLKQHPAALQRLEIECEKAKNKLSAAKVVAIEIPRFIGDTKLRLQVRRIQTENAMEDQVMAFSKWLVKHLAPAAPCLNDIILVGRASRIPRLQSEVSRVFPGLVKSSVRSSAHVLVSNGCAYLARYISGLGSDRLLSQIHAGCLDLIAIRSAAVALVHELPGTTKETADEKQLQLEETIKEREQQNAACPTQTQNPGKQSAKEDPFLGLPNSESRQSVALQLHDASHDVPRSEIQNDGLVMSQMDESECEGELSTNRMLHEALHTWETDDHLAAKTQNDAVSDVEATNAGMTEVTCGTETTKDITHTDGGVSDSELTTIKPRTPFEETEITDAIMETVTDISYQADGSNSAAAKKTCSDGPTTYTNVMISGRCESPDRLNLPKGQSDNKDDAPAGGVGIPTVAFEEIAVFRQQCKVEEQILPRNGKELWVRSRYTAHIHINRCSVPGPSPYVIRLLPSDTMTEPIWLLFNQTKSVQRGNKSTESVFQVAADPRGVVQPDAHQLFVKLSFCEVAQQESFLRAMQQCNYF